MNNESKWGLVAVKRWWVPNWLFEMFCWPIDLVRHKWLPFRYILTTDNPDEIVEAVTKAEAASPPK